MVLFDLESVKRWYILGYSHYHALPSAQFICTKAIGGIYTLQAKIKVPSFPITNIESFDAKLWTHRSNLFIDHYNTRKYDAFFKRKK